MKYAVIDIETTGTRPEKARITEIAIILHDGKNIIDRYATLINPEARIPQEITNLTGISNDMVENAPKFYEVAKDIIQWTEDAVFVAHNVRFDYSFVKAAFRELGYIYQRPTLCTVRLSRKAFPGLPSYSLGRLCDSLNIQLQNRHRALGDAEATALLLSRIMQENGIPENEWIKSETKKSSIPPLLNESVLASIPEQTTGVYYFHNKDGFVIYVGKAIDIKKRLLQHFSLSSKGSVKAMQMKNEIADISFTPTGNELVALLLESDEIKKLKPIYNVSQKKARAVPFFGIFNTYDEKGYIQFTVKKLKDGDMPLNTADSMSSARDTLYLMLMQHNLCQSKCDLHNMPGPCFNYHLHQCLGACVEKEDPLEYNRRALEAISKHSFQKESFLLIAEGRTSTERSIICIEKGQYKGFGYLDTAEGISSVHVLRDSIKPYPHNRDIQQILCTYLKREHQKISYQIDDLNNLNLPS